ncbi:MAG TPA: hypothetical protein VHO50_13645, partial [Bacteroidales bacterium]|nr:hypothetical protein [Bacteroidales bacterium]
MKPFIVFFTCIEFFTFSLLGQSNGGNSNIIPPSPETVALFRFIDYPMDHSTGLPNISIPIFDFKCGELSVPISIGYHSSGRRIADKTGSIGLGWSLISGGVISRTIYGKSDEQDPFSPEIKQAGAITYNDYEYLYSISDRGIYDTEYDIYSYSIGETSGKYIMQGGSPYLIPQRPIKIEGLTTKTIVDDKGNTYSFDHSESCNSIGEPSAWYVTSITSANKADVITFSYTNKLCMAFPMVETETLYSQGTGNFESIEAQWPYGKEEYTNRGHQYTVCRLQEISSRNCKVRIIYNTDLLVDRIDVYNKD